jgi:protein-disulfide isomerase
MTKHVSQRVAPRHAARHVERRTNWAIIGGVVGLGVLALFALLFLAVREPQLLSLAEYCGENTTHCIAAGPADAEVTIVEVSDYTCPACREFNEQTAEQLMATYVETGQARYIVLPYARPVVQEEAGPAVEAALCANELERFFEFHRAAFALQDEAEITRDGLLRIGAEVGLDEAAFTQCLDGNEYGAIVEANIEAAREAGVQATPTFFINDALLEGAQPFIAFQQRIAGLVRS